MGSLLPACATDTERALEATTARISDVPVLVRDSWNPDTCPIALIPWLAWAYSVDEWDPTWDDATKRQAVKDAYNLNRRKGVVWAVKRQFSLLGYPSAILDEGAIITGAFVDARLPFGSATGDFERLAGNGSGKWLAQAGSTLCWFSSISDGTTFAPTAAAPDVDSVTGLKFAGGYWWIIGSKAGAPRVIRASIDDAGVVTFATELAPSEVPSGIAYSGTAFVIAGQTQFFRSTDPTSVAWSAGSAMSAALSIPLCQDFFRYEGGRFIGLDRSSGKLYMSTDDGVTFASIGAGTIGGSPEAFAASSARIVAFCVSGAINTSDDNGSTWTPRTSGTSSTFLAGCAPNGAFVGTTNNGEAVVSTDGASWAVTSLAPGLYLDGITCTGKIAAIVDDSDYSNHAWITDDAGASWTAVSLDWAGPNYNTLTVAIAGETVLVGGQDNAHAPKLSRAVATVYNDPSASWAHYRVRLQQLITAAQGAKLAAALEGQAPKRSQLWTLYFVPYVHLCDGSIPAADGTYTAGEYV